MSKKQWKKINTVETILKPNVVIPTFNYSNFKSRHSSKLLMISLVLIIFFLISIFKNISYPLLWADESMTAIGAERVLDFGYPKVHDGKNIFYDLRHDNMKLGVHEKYDAYVGGAGWAQYYYGCLGYKLADLSEDIYVKTGVFRSTFAALGVVGLFILVYLMCSFFSDKFSKFAFVFLYFLLSLMSISLLLLMREVRYYSIVIFLINLVLGLYCYYRFHKPISKIYFVSGMTMLLWLLFSAFAPAFFIMVLSIGISELMIGLSTWYKTNIKNAFIKSLPIVLSLIFSIILVIPLLTFFKTFEISEAMASFNGFSNNMYRDNIETAYRYFSKFELLYPALILKVLIVLNLKKTLTENTGISRVSNFLTLFFVVYIFSIARMPGFLYTRYIIYLQPVLCVIIIFDFFTLINQFSKNSQKLISVKLAAISVLFICSLSWSIYNNFEIIKGHMYELVHEYKGPLDYIIPFIQEKYENPENLIIATNYEETSYMYYLKSKVIGGYVGNNMAEDSKMNPDLISWRIHWGNNSEMFQHFIQKNSYYVKSFNVKNSATNTISEFNFIPSLTHNFKTQLTSNTEDAAQIWIKD